MCGGAGSLRNENLDSGRKAVARLLDLSRDAIERWLIFVYEAVEALFPFLKITNLECESSWATRVESRIGVPQVLHEGAAKIVGFRDEDPLSCIGNAIYTGALGCMTPDGTGAEQPGSARREGHRTSFLEDGL